MLRSIISQTDKIYHSYKINGFDIISKLPQNEEFRNLINILNEITKERIEKTNKFSFEDMFKNRINMFVPICENDFYTIGIFLIPKGGRIPLHDHPQMLVLSKILFGALNYLSLDYKDDKIQIELPKTLYNFRNVDEDFENYKLQATLNTKSILKKNDVIYLTPFLANIHQFEAQEDSAFLDVLIPKYDLINRFCNFYEIKEMNGRDVVLKYIFPPPDYDCLNMDTKLN